MRAELLIQTHKDQLIQCVNQLHNMDLSIHTSTTKILSLHVHRSAFVTHHYTGTIKHS